MSTVRMILIGFILIGAAIAQGSEYESVLGLAHANGYRPSERVVKAIANAAARYHIDALELTAVGIIETGLGRYAVERVNRNGTVDKGLFQINTINVEVCREYNLDSPEGSAMCAAKLLSRIKKHRPDYVGVYHSKTPKRKAGYMLKVSQVLAKGDLNK